MDMHNNKSTHILSTSSNLLGICFVVLTSLKLLKMAHQTVIDELTAAAIVLFMSSCLLSFLSIRNRRFSQRYEAVADYFFLAGIVILFVTTLLFTFNIIV